jgi:N6-adenosine-specific RNA methylase IME4
VSVYRTVCADPPWPMPRSGGYRWRPGRRSGSTRSALQYESMSVEAIRAVDVAAVAADDAHLWLWAPGRWLEEAYGVARAWGFVHAQTLVWSKAPRGFNPGGDFGSTAEFFLYCKRGQPKAKRKVEQQVFTWPRVGDRQRQHSRKPPAFFQLVEDVSHGPYLELFQREGRLGWDGAGDEALATVEVAGVRNG